MPFDSSSPSDPHPDWHDLCAGYALGNLSSEEQAALTTLLTERPDLRAELLAYEETLALVPYGLPAQPPPSSLEAAIVTAATRLSQAEAPSVRPVNTQTAAPPQPPQRGRPSAAVRSRPWSHLALAAATLAIAIVGVDNHRLRQQRATLQTELNDSRLKMAALQEDLRAEAETQPDFAEVVDILRQPDALVYSLQGTEEAETSSGSLLTLPDHSEVQLVSHNLPVLPEGQVYRLWSVATETANPMFCGQFNNTEVGNVQWTVPDALCNATPFRVIITVDAVVDPQVPKGPAVLEGTI